MPRINGGIIGKSNRPSFTGALGVWVLGDIENARRIGAWPLGLSAISMAVAHAITPFITAYPWSSSGFGTKYSNPATTPTSTGNGISFSPNGDSLAVAHSTTPFITAYPWSSSGFGTKYSNPATTPAGDSNGISFSPNGDSLAVAHGTTPFITAYPWSSSGFGTKYSNPAATPANTSYGVAFTVISV